MGGARRARRSLRRTGRTVGKLLTLPLAPLLPREASRRHKLGLPPGTLVYTGPARGQPTRIDVVAYGPDGHEESQASDVADALRRRIRPGVTWINVEGLEDTGVVEALGEHFRIDPLLLEDLLHVGQRPKVELREGYLFLVLRMFTVDPATEQARHEQVSMVLGPDFVLTFQEGAEGDVFDPVRTRLREGRGSIRTRGADYLLYALVDTIVDHYFLVVEQLSERLAAMEEVVLDAEESHEVVAAIHRFRRENIVVRKAVWPLREMLSTLVRGDSPLVQAPTLPYLRDVQEHAMEVVETVETLRDATQSLMDVHLSMVSNRLNEVMKLLTMISTIFVPLTFIVGVYGMNFRHMPELAVPWAYPAVWAVMVLLGLGLLGYFRRRGWI